MRRHHLLIALVAFLLGVAFSGLPKAPPPPNPAPPPNPPPAAKPPRPAAPAPAPRRVELDDPGVHEFGVEFAVQEVFWAHAWDVHVYAVDRQRAAATVAENAGCAPARSRFVPAFRDGSQVGVKVLSIQADSSFLSLGFQLGDVIERVNGRAMVSPEAALEVYGSLREATTFVVDLQRAGRPLHNVYVVR